jgi:hypothetical protein
MSSEHLAINRTNYVDLTTAVRNLFTSLKLLLKFRPGYSKALCGRTRAQTAHVESAATLISCDAVYHNAAIRTD